MASSNRHWPSMFKSKSTSNPSLNQWSHDLMNSQDDERTPEPKPRWNPRPEQIQILESIFNSGTTNPPRDEIRRIRAQLQEFGQVGDANVFYWFQNRKSRSKHKQRHLQPTKPRPTKPPPPPIAANSSSSSDKSIEKPLSINPSTLIDLLNSPTMSVNQPFLAEPYFLAAHDNVCGSSSRGLTNGICFPDLSENLGNSSVLIGDAMQIDHGRSKKSGDDQTMIKLPTVLEVPGLAEPAPSKSTVFINDVCFEVAIGVPFNVREAFGDDAVLIHSAGQPVPTDEWGVTRQPLQHGGFYYLLRSSTTKPLTW